MAREICANCLRLVHNLLIDFSVENFRSIRTTQTLSLAAASLSELSANTFAGVEGVRLLRGAVIYGPNASGKSNLIRAVNFMRDAVVQSVDADWSSDSHIEPFRLDSTSTQRPSRFEMNFILNGVRHQYGFSIFEQNIQSEWLLAYPKKAPQVWFKRSEVERFHFGPHLGGEKKRLHTLTRPDALFLSVAKQFNHQQLSPIYDWFKDWLQVLGISRVPFADTDYTARMAAKDPELNRLVTDALKFADLGIDKVEVKLPSEHAGDVPVGTGLLPRRRPVIHTFHRFPDSTTVVEFNMKRNESFGTQRFFGLIGRWIEGLRRGSIIFVDELDASMHPALTRALVQMFQNPKLSRHKAQAVMTTHDTTLLDHSVFRRDQIWFVQKDESHASQLYSLQNFHPRKDEALQKGYLAGRYGAMPFVGEFAF
jgi:AAA15 family ATPase/GTPase